MSQTCRRSRQGRINNGQTHLRTILVALSSVAANSPSSPPASQPRTFMDFVQETADLRAQVEKLKSENAELKNKLAAATLRNIDLQTVIAKKSATTKPAGEIHPFTNFSPLHPIESRQQYSFH